MIGKAEVADPSVSRLSRYVGFDEVNHPYLRWQLDQFDAYLGQRVLEIGCGVGGVLELLGPRELKVGLDIDADVLSYARDRFQDDVRYRFVQCDIGNLTDVERAQLSADRFDTVVCINLLEHVQDDVRAMRTIEELLVPGGRLALLVPAHPALYGAYDELDGHHRRYTRRRLRTIIGASRFTVERLYYFNAAGAIGWWLQYRLLRRAAHGRAQLGLMNRLLPLARPIEERLKPPFGLSLVAVCRKAWTTR